MISKAQWVILAVTSTSIVQDIYYYNLTSDLNPSDFDVFLAYFLPVYDFLLLMASNVGLLAMIVYLEYESQETNPHITIYPITKEAVYYSMVWLFPQNIQMFTSVAYILYYHQYI